MKITTVGGLRSLLEPYEDDAEVVVFTGADCATCQILGVDRASSFTRRDEAGVVHLPVVITVDEGQIANTTVDGQPFNPGGSQ